MNATQMKKAPISVIITTYNDYEFLDQAIQSVLEQNLLPEEIVVIDDGSSSPNAGTIVNRYINNRQNVQVCFFRKENGGASSARNFGLEKASQKYIAFLDVDDRMLPENLSEKYQLIKNLDDEYFGVYGGAIRSTGEVQLFNDFDGVADPDLIDEKGKGIPGGSPFFLFNKKAIEEIGGFDEDIKCNEDYDILIRLIKSNRKCKGSTTSGFYRNIRPGSLSRPHDPLQRFNCVMGFLKKAEANGFYSLEYLNERKMAIHVATVKGLLKQKKIWQAFVFARKGFKFSKPVTRKQKLVYFASFSFLG